MMNDLERKQTEVMFAMQFYNLKNKCDYDYELIDELEKCKSIKEIENILETKKFKNIKEVLKSKEFKDTVTELKKYQGKN